MPKGITVLSSDFTVLSGIVLPPPISLVVLILSSSSVKMYLVWYRDVNINSIINPTKAETIEAVAFFIKEGIQARKDLFQKVMSTVDKIRELKEQAKKSLSQEETQ